MDQAKEFLAVALKHGFWIGSSVVLLGALGIWYVSVTDLDDQTSKQNSKIKGNASKISQYRGELSDQPNDLSHARMQALIDGRIGEVLKAWENVFDAQRKILTWPTVMKDEFLNEFKYVKDPETGIVDTNRLKLPFEKYEQFPPPPDGDNVPPSLLRRYEQYIGRVLPDYAAIAGTDWTAEFSPEGWRNGDGHGNGNGNGDDDGQRCVDQKRGRHYRCRERALGALDDRKPGSRPEGSLSLAEPERVSVGTRRLLLAGKPLDLTSAAADRRKGQRRREAIF